MRGARHGDRHAGDSELRDETNAKRYSNTVDDGPGDGSTAIRTRSSSSIADIFRAPSNSWYWSDGNGIHPGSGGGGVRGTVECQMYEVRPDLQATEFTRLETLTKLGPRRKG